MAVTGQSELGDSLIVILQRNYELRQPLQYVYAQAPLAYVPENGVLMDGNRFSSLRLPFFSPLAPANTPRSEYIDIAPERLADQSFDVSPSFYANAVQLGLLTRAQSQVPVEQAAAEIVADNAAQTIDFIARSAAVAGSAVAYGTGTARSGLSSAAPLTPALLYTAAAFLTPAPKIPSVGAGVGAGLAAIMRDVVIMDLAEDSGVILIGQYRDSGPEVVLNGEIGMHMSGVKLVQSNNAKVFHGGGSTAGRGPTSGVLAADVAAGSTSITINSSVSSGNNNYYTIGSRETTALGENTDIETFYVADGSTTTMNVIGSGPNGGLNYAYSSGAVIESYNQAHAVVVFGARSLAKVYDGAEGEFGQIIPPDDTGTVRQFRTLGWRHIIGFGRPAENRLFRLEVGVERPVIGI
jgi:N4-gp56 family major capsid protein